MEANIPCVPRRTFCAAYFDTNVRSKPEAEQRRSRLQQRARGQMRADTEYLLASNSGGREIHMFEDVMQRNVRVEPAARVRAGADKPAKAASGFSGVAKLEKTRLYQTTSGLILRIVLIRWQPEF